MNLDKVDIFPTLGMCITLPKSVSALNRAVKWIEEKVSQQRYYAYYDVSRFNRHRIGTFLSLEDAVKARNNYELGLVKTKSVKGGFHHDV